MSITLLASLGYMFIAKVPNPFGKRDVRALLAARGLTGFFGGQLT